MSLASFAFAALLAGPCSLGNSAPHPHAAALAASPQVAAAPLATRLLPLIEAHKGKVAVAVKHLQTGETFAYRENDPMPTASLIKFPVMIEVYRQAAEGKLDLNKPVTLRNSDKVPGSGILTRHFSDGAAFPLRDAVRLMIAYSDNTATNLVLDAIGIAATAETMQRMGYPHTKIHSKVFRRDTSVFPERSKQFGLGSTTAAEMLRLLESLHKKELVSAEASEAMLAQLRACEDPNKFPRFLPAGTAVAMKTGSVDAARTAAGILYGPAGPIAVCVLTAENEDQRWVPDNAGDQLCAEIAREVFAHFNPTASPRAPELRAPAPPPSAPPTPVAPASRRCQNGRNPADTQRKQPGLDARRSARPWNLRKTSCRITERVSTSTR